MNIDRAWALTKIFFQSHVFNWPWRSREHRRDVRTNVLSRVAPEYFKRYFPDSEEGEVRTAYDVSCISFKKIED